MESDDEGPLVHVRLCSPWRVENGTMVFMADERRLNLPLIKCRQGQLESDGFDLRLKKRRTTLVRP